MTSRDSTPTAQPADVAELVASMVATDDAAARAQVASRLLAAVAGSTPAPAAPWRQKFADDGAAELSGLALLLNLFSREDTPALELLRPELLRCVAIRLQSLADVASMAHDPATSREELAGLLYGPVCMHPAEA